MRQHHHSDMDALIAQLQADARPVRPLAHPTARAVRWIAAALLYTALAAWMIGLRADLPQMLAEPKFLIEIAAPFLTGVMAAMAAFCSGTPGRPMWQCLAPLPPLLIWIGSLGAGCASSLFATGTDGIALAPDLICFPYIVLMASVPWLLLLVMIRRAAPLTPVLTVALASLSAAALGAATLRLIHPVDASLMVLVWQFGSVVVIASAGALLGRSLLCWPDGLARSA